MLSVLLFYKIIICKTEQSSHQSPESNVRSSIKSASGLFRYCEKVHAKSVPYDAAAFTKCTNRCKTSELTCYTFDIECASAQSVDAFRGWDSRDSFFTAVHLCTLRNLGLIGLNTLCSTYVFSFAYLNSLYFVIRIIRVWSLKGWNQSSCASCGIRFTVSLIPAEMTKQSNKKIER